MSIRPTVVGIVGVGIGLRRDHQKTMVSPGTLRPTHLGIFSSLGGNHEILPHPTAGEALGDEISVG
jgi:hypothetical protein